MIGLRDDASHLRARFWYLATPYSRYPLGIDAAFKGAAQIAGALIAQGVPVFSPIVHSHPIARAFGLDPLDHDKWIALDTHMMRGCDGLLIAKMHGWEESRGVGIEIAAFRAMHKPIVTLEITGEEIAEKIGEALS